MYSSSFSCAVIGSRHTPFEQVLEHCALVVQAEPQGHFPATHAPVHAASLTQVPAVTQGPVPFGQSVVWLAIVHAFLGAPLQTKGLVSARATSSAH